jgi:carbonic anhydrase
MKFSNKAIIPTFLLILISCTFSAQVKKEHSLYNYLTGLYSKKSHQKETDKLVEKKLKARSRTHSFMQKVQNTEFELQNNSTNSSGKGSDQILEAWLRIQSYSFADEKAFPTVALPNKQFDEVKYDKDRFRINVMKTNDTNKPELYFYFRMNKDHIFYSATETDINVLGAIDFELAKFTQRNKINDDCFEIHMKTNDEFTICSKDFPTRDKWYCESAKRLKIVDQFCEERIQASFQPTFTVEQKVYQPIILLPQESPHCNQDFTYSKSGSDWECQCKEGREQSPIDIVTKTVFKSPAIPVFSFQEVEAVSPITSLDGTMIAKEHIKIKYWGGAIRIFHTNFGKIVTLDGTVYHAEEIIFHSPAEHTINGVRHEMEMQVVGYGQSKGDIAKQVVISFLFEQKPGVYNKFIDDVDFFNLPTKDYKEKDIVNNLYIPKVLYSSDSEEMVTMKPVSMYTYQGSLTAPPCTERTIHYVVANPIPIAHAVVTMLKEALRTDDNQNVDDIANIRETQPLNDRTVFFYDASNCRTPKYFEPKEQKTGHYEKVPKQVTEYFYVNGDEPSGIPDSFVVSENEAKGIQEKKGPKV